MNDRLGHLGRHLTGVLLERIDDDFARDLTLTGAHIRLFFLDEPEDIFFVACFGFLHEHHAGLFFGELRDVGELVFELASEARDVLTFALKHGFLDLDFLDSSFEFVEFMIDTVFFLGEFFFGFFEFFLAIQEFFFVGFEAFGILIEATRAFFEATSIIGIFALHFLDDELEFFFFALEE